MSGSIPDLRPKFMSNLNYNQIESFETLTDPGTGVVWYDYCNTCNYYLDNPNGSSEIAACSVCAAWVPRHHVYTIAPIDAIFYFTILLVAVFAFKLGFKLVRNR